MKSKKNAIDIKRIFTATAVCCVPVWCYHYRAGINYNLISYAHRHIARVLMKNEASASTAQQSKKAPLFNGFPGWRFESRGSAALFGTCRYHSACMPHITRTYQVCAHTHKLAYKVFFVNICKWHVVFIIRCVGCKFSGA